MTVQPFGVLLVELTVGHKTIETVFFIIDAVMMYNELLGRDWIHSSRCIPLSLHQYLTMWYGNCLAEVVKIDAKPFVLTSNATNALLYMEDMGPITFFDHNNKGRQTNYAMMQRLDKGDDHSLRPIFTFADGFAYSSNSDQ